MNELCPDVPKGWLPYYFRAFIRLIRKLKIKILLGSKVKIGKNVAFGPNSKLMIPNVLSISDNFRCGANFFVQTNVIAGDDILISSDVSFVGNDHFVNVAGYSNFWSGRKDSSTVVLKGDNFIGYRATIVGNVEVGKGAIIGAGALVTKNVAPYSVVAGVPAREVSKRRLTP